MFHRRRRPAPSRRYRKLRLFLCCVVERLCAGLLSPDLAAGIRRAKGAKPVGARIGNWLSADQAKRLINCPDITTLKGKRDHAILAVLLGCGLRRSEAVHLRGCLRSFHTGASRLSIMRMVAISIRVPDVWTMYS